MSRLENVTTYSAFKRHLAWRTSASDQPTGRVGRGLALCGGGGGCNSEFYDQTALDAVKRKYIPGYQQIAISSLPLCARCALFGGAA
jgi:hypothetical protein